MEAKILVVDDEVHITQLIEQTLEDLEDDGVELLIANNGEDALQMIEDAEASGALRPGGTIVEALGARDDDQPAAVR